MLRFFIEKVHKSKFLRPSPRILICVPCGSTQVERRAIRESAAMAGAREVYLIEEPNVSLQWAQGYLLMKHAVRWF